VKVKNRLFLSLLAMLAVTLSGLAQAEDVRMFVRHDVADYGVWKKGYDNYAPMQKKAGVYFKAAYRSVDNPNDVTVIHDFHSLEKAKAFADSADLKAAMSKLGVKGAPQIWYTTK
jgi:hypothetical protein